MGHSEHQKLPEGQSRRTQKSLLKPGMVLQNRYKIDSVLAGAGSGRVYQVFDLRFPGNRWALKVYQTIDPDVFYEAMQQLVSFHHSHLAKIVDFFQEADFSCLVMELVHGRSLEQILQETVGPLPERQVLSWGVQCADALIYLHRHQKSLTHYRNLSPRKILISTIGEVKLIPRIPQKLDHSTVPGIMGYAPPEVFDEAKSCDEKTDVYTLAAVLHRCLTGGNASSIPFVFVPLGPVNPALDSAIERILEKATQPNPSKRYADLTEFRTELYRCLQAILSLQPYRRRMKKLSSDFWWALMAISGVAIITEVYLFFSLRNLNY